MRTLIITIQDIEDGHVYQANKHIAEVSYNSYPWSTWAEILHQIVSDLEAAVDEEKRKKE